jgi:hypothetical protein
MDPQWWTLDFHHVTIISSVCFFFNSAFWKTLHHPLFLSISVSILSFPNDYTRFHPDAWIIPHLSDVFRQRSEVSLGSAPVHLRIRWWSQRGRHNRIWFFTNYNFSSLSSSAWQISLRPCDGPNPPSSYSRSKSLSSWASLPGVIVFPSWSDISVPSLTEKSMAPDQLRTL